MDPDNADFMALLEEYAAQGRLDELFQPFSQEQDVLQQRMALGQGMRQRGPQRASPTGAFLGGLSDAVGNVSGAVMQAQGLKGQQALGGRMQKDASSRMGALIRLLRGQGEAQPTYDVSPADLLE